MVRTPKTNNYLLNKYDIGEYAAVHNNYEKLVDLIYMRVGYIAEVISAVVNYGDYCNKLIEALQERGII